MVLVERPRPPQLVQIPGERTGRVDQDVGGVDDLVQRAQDLGLCRAYVGFFRLVAGVDALFPTLLVLAVLGDVRVGDPVRALAQLPCQRAQSAARVGDQRLSGELVAVVGTDVEVEEADAGAFEEGA